MEGVINLLKTPGMTSHDCVSALRRLLGEKRVGHTGTLDPMACGVLPICIGKATRLAEYTLEHEKAYRAEMLLGLTSDTQDLTGEILTRNPVSGITEEKLLQAFEKFMGPVEQVTPAYSAAKHHGKKLYQLAREGAPVPRKIRSVFIHKISLFRVYPLEEYPRVIFDVVCSKGTYIRTLCSDLGKVLGPGAVMSFLVRTASGPFSLENTISLEEIDECLKSGNQGFLQPMNLLVNHLPVVELKASAVRYVKNGSAVNGQHFVTQGEIPHEALIRLEHNNQLIGIGTFVQDDNNACLIKPKKILI